MGNCVCSQFAHPNSSTAPPSPGTSNPYSKGGGYSPTVREDTCLDGEILPTTHLKVYSFRDLKKATGNFNDSTLLGRGGFGRVYKGWLDEKTLAPAKSGSGMIVAIKKWDPGSTQGFQEWKSEVDILGSLSHPNLVKLVGYCREDQELLLVYEFMQNGSLADHLFGQSSATETLSWYMRLKIVIGAARGLAFLHSLENKVILRDVKSFSILLDGNYSAKISDFGLARRGPSDEDSHVTTRVMGTYGYADPAYLATGYLTVKSDVYGFGVVLLEILTGLRAVDGTRPSEQVSLVLWAMSVFSHKRNLKLLMDARIEGQYSSKEAFLACQLALQCLQDEPSRRPAMKDVVEVLEQIEANKESTKGSRISHPSKALLSDHEEGIEDEESSIWEGIQSGIREAKEWEGMLQKAEVLRRKKDFLHLVLSYPMKPQADSEVSFQYLRGLFSQLNQHVGELQALLSDDNHVKHGNEFSEVIEKGISEDDFQAVENTLSKYDFHMVAYLPQEADVRSNESWRQRIEVGISRQTNGTFEAPDEMLTVAVNSAIRQVSKSIEDGSLRKIGISGSGGEKVANALKDMPVIISKSSVVLCISVSQYHSIEEVRQKIAAEICGIQEIDDGSEGALDQVLPQDFLLLLDCIDPEIDLHHLEIPDHGIVVLTTRSQNAYWIMDVDLEIRMEDHLLPWELFRWNVGTSLVDSSSAIKKFAVQLVKECQSHLLAIILLARALKDVTDIGVWEVALHELTSQSSNQLKGRSEVMVHVMNFIWDRKDIRTKYCIHQLMLMGDDQQGDSLVSDWFSKGLVETLVEGKGILEDLINSFLVENVGEGCVRMREETEIVLQNYFIPYLPGLYLREGGSGLTETLEDEQWNAVQIYLKDCKLSDLPENPKCQALKILWLDNNPDLMEIPELFFKDMPLLHSLDLSYTSIKYLPDSISYLVSLRTFNLRGCELLMELPPQIRALRKLERFDLEGTEIMYLPEEIGELTSLSYFRISLCGRANRYKVTKQMGTTIPPKVLSKLSQLTELSIDVNPHGEWWDADVKAILNELSHLKCLKILELYLPSVELLQLLKWDNGKLMYPNLLQFRITVGHHPQRIISHLPLEVEEILKKWEKSKKCLKYINGEGIPIEVSGALKHSSVFFLDRHWTIEVLSEFGHENLVELESCLLVECNELQTIIDGDCEIPWDVDEQNVFGRLQNLGIHYMKNLQSIWKGPIDKYFLSNLRSLSLHTCPNLTTIFMPDLLGNLDKLEELIVEECPKIKSLVTQEPSNLKPGHFLQSLRKISLVDLPELISISGGLSIGPVLETLIVCNCPKLGTLCTKEVSSTNLKIKGEKEWWDTLKWHESEWSSSSTWPAYEELIRGEDLMEQLAKDIYSR